MEDKYTETETYKVTPVSRPPELTISVPGSKSITNRALLLAILADGESVLRRPLESDDTRVFLDSLERMGIPNRKTEGSDFIIQGNGCIPAVEKVDLYFENAGTACRFLIAACATGNGEYHFDGTKRMRERPLSELLGSLEKLGTKISPNGREYLPLSLITSGMSGGEIEIDTSRSSQFLSGLMMASIRAGEDLRIKRVGGLVGRPYIDITFNMMRVFGIPIERNGYEEFTAPSGTRYDGIEYNIEPDASTASYFFASAAVTGGKVVVNNLWRESSIQGDIHFLDVLEMVGCKIRSTDEGTLVEGPEKIKGIDVDMKDISDTFMTLAALAPFADGPTIIRGIAHTRGQESDRVTAMATELKRLGADVSDEEDAIRIRPSKLTGCAVRTYNDHRIAMALSVVGLRVPGIIITGADCVSKTAPKYFELFHQVETSGE